MNYADFSITKHFNKFILYDNNYQIEFKQDVEFK